MSQKTPPVVVAPPSPKERVTARFGQFQPDEAQWLLRELVADQLHSLPGAARAVEAWLFQHGLKARQ